MAKNSHDGQRPGSDGPSVELDGHAHGRAALLLVESLIHGLANRSVITVAEAIEIIEVAAEVEDELARAEGHDEAEIEARSLLAPISKSLGVDLGE